MHSSPLPSTSAWCRALAATGLVGLLALTGCGGPKGFYAGTTARAERAAAEAAAAPAADTTLQTQATYRRLVEQMQRDGLWFASLAHLDALEQRWGTSPGTVRLRADALRQTGQAADAMRQYTLLLATPLAAAGYHGLGLLAGANADFPGAITLLAQAQQREPTDAVILSDLGYAHLRAGRTEAARVPLMQAAQLLPDNPQVQANLVLYLIANGQGEEADAVMAAQRLPPGTRDAIRQAALTLRSAPGTASPLPERHDSARPTTVNPNLIQVTGATSAGEPGGPLALRPAGWPRRIQVGLRNAPAPALAASPTASTPVPSDLTASAAPSVASNESPR